MLAFTLTAACPVLDVPAGTTIAVDPQQRALIQGEVFAFRDVDDNHFLARIESVSRATKTVVDRDGCQIIGRVVSLHPMMH